MWRGCGACCGSGGVLWDLCLRGDVNRLTYEAIVVDRLQDGRWHLARIASADLEASPAGVSFLTGTILAASSTIVSRSATEIADLAGAFRATAGHDALSADDQSALKHAADFLQGSANALQNIAARLRFSTDRAERAS